MKLSEEMAEVAKEAGIYGPVIEDWVVRVRELERPCWLVRLWNRIFR